MDRPGVPQDTLDREQARLYELEDHLCWKVWYGMVWYTMAWKLWNRSMEAPTILLPPQELVTPLDSATDVLPFIPWYLGCNQQRFPYW